MKVSRVTVAKESENVFFLPDLADTARDLNAPQFTVEHDLAVVRDLLEFYRRANDGAVPDGGTNEEFVSRLLGANPKKFAVLPSDLPAINSVGQLVDRWGTAYFMHPVSERLIEIRSAGPDRKMWTKDDTCEPPLEKEMVGR